MSRYIDADELWKEIESVEYYGRDAEVSRICGLIQNAPTSEVKPIVYGEWIRFKEFENGYWHIKCSRCGQYWSIADHDKTFKYCFNCGAKMQKSEEEE